MLHKLFTKKHGKAGFTLIEMLVTITIIGIISITTFAIVLSASNTFKKEKEIMDAHSMKEIVTLTLKEHLRKRAKIGLVNENLAKPVDANVPDVLFGSDEKDEYGFYVLDPRLKEYHMLYSENGRIYTVTSNLEGKYYVGGKTAEPLPTGTLSVLPISTKGLAGNAGNTLDGKLYGRIPLMHDDVYEGFFVDIRFRPIFTNTQGRYRDIQVIVKIYDDASMTADHLAAEGTETFHMLNVENRPGAIKFQNDVAVMTAEPTRKTPQDHGFKFCYFV